MTLTVGSLFSGIGGLELGLERAGMKTVWQVECDPYAQKVLAKHWPHVLRCPDVRIARGHLAEPFSRGPNTFILSPVDVICGGFPCQDISNAGKRAGIDGERSGLWSEFHRLICELRPRFVLVENVAALLVRGLDRVLGDLATSGYDAEWDCIPAAAVGAPHRRDRLFVVAYAQRDAVREQSEPEPGRGGATVAGFDGEARDVADTSGQRLEERQSIFRDGGKGRSAALQNRGAREDVWASEPDVGRVADGIPSRVDRLRCLGNAVVPAVAEFIGRRILEAVQ